MGFYRMSADGRPVARPVKEYVKGERIVERDDDDLVAQRMTPGELCPFCHKKFKNEHGLSSHIGRKHPAEKARTEYVAASKVRAEQNKSRGD